MKHRGALSPRSVVFYSFGLGLYAVLFLSLFSSFASGQALSGIVGTVTDSSGAVVSEARISATNDATGVISRTVTTSVGGYILTDLIPGTYTVRIEKPGYKPVSIRGLIVEAGGKKSNADAALSAGAINEVVTVTASPIALETEEPEIGTSVEHEVIEEVPIEMGNNAGGNTNRGRRIDSFMFLTPGVTGNEFSHRINGGADFENEVVFNGLPLVKDETPGFQEIVNPPYEMVSEARVSSSVFSTKYGLGQGVASFQFASGTNTLHGSAFELMRNSYFDAPGAYPLLDANGHKLVPVDHENNFGFSLGGPIVIPHLYNGKDKTFFHFDLEWYRLNQGSTSLGTVPTDPMRNGDFSNDYYVDPNTGNQVVVPIYVPQSWATNPSFIPAGCTISGFASPQAAAGQQFPGNKIDPSCFSPTSLKILALIPHTNDPRTPNPNNNNVFTAVSSFPTREQKWGLSIDHNLTDKQKIHGSYWRSPYKAYGAGFVFGANNQLSSPGFQATYGNGVVLNYSNTLKNNLIMTVGAFYEQDNNDFSAGASTRGNFFPSLVAGETFTPQMNFNNGQNGISGFGSGGAGGGAPIQHGKGLSLANNWIYTRGRHTLNFGLEFRHSTQHIFGQNCNCIGSFNFNSETTSNNDLNTSDPFSVANTGSSFASFLLGNLDSANRSFAALVKLRNYAFAPYVQDNIKVTPKLTVDVGLRWDIMIPFTDVTTTASAQTTFLNLSIPNPGAISTTTGQPLMGAYSVLGTCSYCVGYDRAVIHWKNLGPRIGFAYQLNKKTVVSSSYAVNFINGGAYDYGDTKIGNYFTGLLAGFLPASAYNDVAYPGPGIGNWDTSPLLPLPVPAPQPFSPTVCNGVQSLQCVEAFAKDPGVYPYTQSWNAGVQRELPWNLFVSASYVGNRGVHLPSYLNPFNQLNPILLNQLCPNGVTPGYQGGTQCVLSDLWLDTSPGGAQSALQQLGFGKDANGLYSPYQNFYNDFGGANTGTTLQQALLPLPQYPGIAYNDFENRGTSRYNALQTQLQKRFTQGVSFLVNYTLSRAMANAETGFGAFTSAPLNKYNLKPEYTITSYDQTHFINITSVYELPIGPGKPFLNHGGTLAKNAIGGWQVSGVLQYQSGTPLGVSANGNPLNNGFNRANVVPGVNPFIGSWNNVDKVDANGNPLPILNPAAFSDPGSWTLGNAPRQLADIRLPWSSNENVALAKKFFLGERVHAELRMEFFNILNRDLKVCSPSTDITAGNGFGLAPQQCQSNHPRQGQAYFRIQF